MHADLFGAFRAKDTRAEWLTDPVRGPQWPTTLKDFDTTFGTAAEKTGREVTELNAEKAAEPHEEFSWGSIFQDELTDAPQWHQKYDHLVVGKF